MKTNPESHMTRIACILNPNARDGLSLKQWDDFEQALVNSGFDVDLYQTEAPGHAMDIAEGLIEENHELVVAVGGETEPCMRWHLACVVRARSWVFFP